MKVGRWLVALAALLLASAPMALATMPAPVDAASIDNASLTPAARIAAGRRELLAVSKSPEDRKRIADVATKLGDMLGDLEDGAEAEHHEEAIRDYRLALTYYTKRSAPSRWAALQNDLGVELRNRSRGSDRQNVELALAAFRAALSAHNRESDPASWAMVERNLCETLRERKAGPRAANVEAAVAACKLALTVQTRVRWPDEFADTAENLGLAYGARIIGSVRDNLDAQIAAYEEAVGASSSRNDAARTARLQRRVGLLYVKRADVEGSGNADLERAVASLTASLSAREPDLDGDARARAEQALGQAYGALRIGDHADHVERALAAFREALTTVSPSSDFDEWNAIQIDIGNALQHRVLGDRAENVEGAIAAYNRALSSTNKKIDPVAWAAIQNDLGTALDARINGDRTTNLKRAIAGYQNALRIGRRTQPRSNIADYLDNLGVAYGHLAANVPAAVKPAIDNFQRSLALRTPGSLLWGTTQNNLGTVLLKSQRGSAAANIDAALGAFRKAVLARRRELDPEGWAQSMDNLGTALFERIRGSRAENLEEAIRSYETALELRTKVVSPRDWAATQNNLAEALVSRITGDRGENVQRAIEAYRAALTVYTFESDPINWAAVEDNLGNAYMHLDRGSRNENIERAIEAFNAALKVRTREAAPMQWAGTTNDLAIAYGDRDTSRSANIEKALELHKATLQVLSRTTTPLDWARAWNNLGTLQDDEDYRDRTAGIEAAIKSYKAALLVRTRRAFPKDWADTQNNMANAYFHRQWGDRAANIEEAIRGYRAVLEVRTRLGNPIEFIATEKALARAYSKRPVGDTKDNQRVSAYAYAAAMAAVDDLVGDGLDPRETAVAMSAAGELFRSAALQAGRERRFDDALAIAERGRTRILQLAFRLDSDVRALPPDARARLDAIRAELRTLNARGNPPGSEGNVTARDATEIAASQQVARQRAATLRLQISAILPRSQAPAERPSPPAGGAIAIPIVAPEGAMILFLTAEGLSAVDVSGLDDERMHAMFYGPGRRFGEGGWTKGYQSIAGQSGPAALTKDWSDALASFEDEAWRLFGKPLEDGLQQRGIEPGAHVILITQDYLARMPLWLARDPASGGFLGDIYRITSTPNLGSLKALKAGSRGVMAWFNDAAYPSLQLTALARHLFISHDQAATLIGSDAAKSPASLIDSLQGHRVWFFWTHGRFDRFDARQSFLQLARTGSETVQPGLTVGTLLDADFRSAGPDLVVLSACETGQADVAGNDELVGLPTAFLQAGARGVISALWPVREDATALLMAKFGELSKDGERLPSEALRLAKLWLRSASAPELIDYVNMSHPDLKAQSDLARGYEFVSKALQDGDAPGHPFEDPYFWAAFNFTGTE